MNQNRYDGRNRLLGRTLRTERNLGHQDSGLSSGTVLIKTFIWLWVIWALFGLAVTGGLIWMAVHFIVKYW